MSGVSTSFTPIDPGEYEAKFVEFENGVSQAGNAKVVMVYEITEEGEFVGRKLKAHKGLSNDALWSLKRDLIALGADPDDIAGSFDTDELLPDLVGNDCKIVVDLGEPNEDGKQFNNITEVKSLY
jgi:hypothetical protein